MASRKTRRISQDPAAAPLPSQTFNQANCQPSIIPVDVPDDVAVFLFGTVGAAIVGSAIGDIAPLVIGRVAVTEHKVASLIIMALGEAIAARTGENAVATRIAGSAQVGLFGRAESL